MVLLRGGGGEEENRKKTFSALVSLSTTVLLKVDLRWNLWFCYGEEGGGGKA